MHFLKNNRTSFAMTGRQSLLREDELVDTRSPIAAAIEARLCRASAGHVLSVASKHDAKVDGAPSQVLSCRGTVNARCCNRLFLPLLPYPISGYIKQTNIIDN